MSPVLVGIISIVAFLLLLTLRLPIAYAMAIVGFIGFSYLTSPAAAFDMVSKEIVANFSSYSLSVVPMFIWMGFLAYHSGLGTKLYVFAYRCIGHLPGGLAIATQVAAAIFGAICGSNTATAATIGAIALPEMKKYKYDPSLATASVAAGGVLGILIPPSIVFIVYGMATEQSIGKLFIAGIIPGILLTLLYIITIYIICKRKPELGPRGPKTSLKEKLDALRGSLGQSVAIFVIVMGGLFVGFFTPTEAGAIGAGGVLVVTLITRDIKWEGVRRSLVDSTRTTAMIMLLLTGAMIFGRLMAITRVPFELAQWTEAIALPPFAIFGIIVAIYLVLGCFIDALAMILLTIPIFYPIVVNTLGYDPIWFGVIIVLVVGMGVITPPVGMNVYILKGIATDVPLEVIFKGIWPFLFAIIICVAILMVFPQLVTFLPSMIK